MAIPDKRLGLGRSLLVLVLAFCLTSGLLLGPVCGEALEKARLLAPIRAGGNDGINNLILIPQLDTAVTLGKGGWRVELSTEYIKNSLKETQGTSRTEITTTTYETHFRVTYGLLEYLDLFADLSFTAYDGTIGAVINTESFFVGSASTLGAAEVDADREMTDPIIGAKFQVWAGKRECSAVAVRAAVKLPIADDRDIHSTGDPDLSIGVVGSLDRPSGVWHAHVDYTLTGNADHVRPQVDMDLENVLSFGVGYLFELVEDKLAVGAQVNGYSNPYRDVPVGLEGFDGPPVNLLLDLRWYPYRQFSVELAAGPGLTSDAADFTGFLGLAYER